jgi:putative ABC transport system permease protein
MTILRRLGSVLGWIARRDTAERRLDDELQAFVEMAAAEKMRDGVPPAEARRQARLELGGVEQVKEQVRTHRHGGWLDEVGRDTRYAFRMFNRRPGFTFVIVLTLALGIGANTAIFSLIDALMLRWLPVYKPQELVQLSARAPGSTGPGGSSFSHAIVRGLANQREAFAGVAGFQSSAFDVGSPGSLRRVPGALVTGDFYSTLGLAPAAGRLLGREDDEAGAPVAAVISDGYWEREFARSHSAVGQVILVNQVPATIVGVSPPGFVGATVGLVADITLAVSTLSAINPPMAGLLGPGNFWLISLARPAAGLSSGEAMARLNTAWPALAESLVASHWPADRRRAMAESRFEATPGGTGYTFLRGMYQKPLYILMVFVGLVLLIACANVASLLLARASARQREIAVRLAIGASRARIVRQLLIESALLSLMGAACGVIVAWFTTTTLIDLISEGPVRITFDLSPNLRVLGFTTAVALATSVLFGIAPALQSTKANPGDTLKEDARTSTSRSRLLPSLVSLQVALALVLLAGAGLFVRTLQNLQNLDPGFKSEGVLIVTVQGRGTDLPSDTLADLQRLPGVAAASFATHSPLSGATWSDRAVPAGQPLPNRDNAVFIGADPNFFDALQIRVLAGRPFNDRDVPAGPFVAVVNERYAQQHFAGTNPVGQRLTAEVAGRREDLEIVGLANNVHTAGLRQAPRPIVYVPYVQLPKPRQPDLIVRASGSISGIASAVQQTLQAKVPTASVNVRALSTQVASTIVQERMLASLAGAFGVLALALTCIGVYGLLAYTVEQRTKEIGIRMALGAERSRVVRSVLAGGARLVLIGIALGLPVAWVAAKSIAAMLFNLTPMDPLTIGGAIVTLALAAQLAAYLPARRASAVDPLVALRHE